MISKNINKATKILSNKANVSFRSKIEHIVIEKGSVRLKNVENQLKNQCQSRFDILIIWYNF